MENPEEVLQALEEFQKMRPTEIPRELDEYINFVAKTGDSVYQWTLVKPLFREKLVRVMTDFYESCPTLDLASSPNIEQFNYDNMKCNLLDLLESFANAPFTIQRLCELLTSPRKEYNRVDKFMRAIEKNILVVSTREPGRRSENGDSLLNGTLDEDISINQQQQQQQQQQSHEIEMEAWEKECTNESTLEHSDSTLSLSLALLKHQQDANISETTIQTNIINESNDDCQTVIQDKINVNDVDDILTSTNQEVLTSAVLTDSSSPLIIPDSIISTTNEVDNLTENINQINEMVDDVTESILNEDTNSQPVSDTDNNDTNYNEKLQTTFDSKDFTDTVDNENVAVITTNEDEKTDIVAEAVVDDNLLNKIVCNNDDETLVVTEETAKNQSNELSSNVVDENEGITKVSCSVITTNHDSKIEQEIVKADDDDKDEITIDKNEELKTEQEPTTIVKCKEETAIVESSLEVATTTCEASETTDNELKNDEVEKETTDVSKPPIVEEPTSEETDKKDDKVEEENNTVIQEAMDDDAKITNNTVPDPIPIVEEPKDDTSASSDECTAVVVETVDQSVISESSEQQEASIDNTKVTTNIEIVEKNAQTESMEIDNEESMTVCQNDEPMEEESSFQTRS